MLFFKTLYPHFSHSDSDIALSPLMVAAFLAGAVTLSALCVCCIYCRARHRELEANVNPVGAPPHDDLEQGLRP